MTKRSLGLVFLFSIITLGIYNIYFVVKTNAELNRADGGTRSGLMVVFLSIITFGIYGLVWHYKAAVRINKLGGSDNVVAVLVLTVLFGGGLISHMVLQSSMNKASTAVI